MKFSRSTGLGFKLVLGKLNLRGSNLFCEIGTLGARFTFFAFSCGERKRDLSKLTVHFLSSGWTADVLLSARTLTKDWRGFESRFTDLD